MPYDSTFDFAVMAASEASLVAVQKQIDGLVADPSTADNPDAFKALGYCVRTKYEHIALLLKAAHASREKQTAEE